MYVTRCCIRTNAARGKERVSMERLTYFMLGLSLRKIRKQRVGPGCVEFRQTGA